MMAGASSASSCDVAKLKCSVCNQQFKDPKILHCLHSFCKMCICSLESDGPTEVVCPLCSRETKVDCIDELKSSFHLVEKLEALEIQEQLMESPQKKLTCGSCAKVRGAAARCLDCSMYLCSSCKMVHHRIPALSQHSVVSPDDLCSGKGLKTPRKEKVHGVCTKHPGEKLKFFCETCQEIVCRDCRVAEHESQKHATVDIDVRTSAWRSLTQKDAVSLEKAVTLSQSTLDTITKARSEFTNHAAFLKNDVKVYANSIRKMIETEEKRVMKDIERQNQEQQETLKGCTRKVNSAIEKMKRAIETANEVADVPSDQDCCDLQPIIKDELSRLLKGDPSNLYNGLPLMTFQKRGSLELGQIEMGFRVILPPLEFRSKQANPGGSSKTSGPANPGGSSKTSGPANPGGSSQTSGPANPGGSSKTSGPANPGGSSQTSGPANPRGSSKTSGPANPRGYSKTSGPANPGGSSKTSGPANPGGSSKPSAIPGVALRSGKGLELPGAKRKQMTSEEALKQGSESRNVKRCKTKL